MRMNICGIIRSEVNDVNLLLEVRRYAIEACKSQGTNWFLGLVLRECVEVDRNRLVEGGP